MKLHEGPFLADLNAAIRVTPVSVPTVVLLVILDSLSLVLFGWTRWALITN
jgi:hypothetical protein